MHRKTCSRYERARVARGDEICAKFFLEAAEILSKNLTEVASRAFSIHRVYSRKDTDDAENYEPGVNDLVSHDVKRSLLYEQYFSARYLLVLFVRHYVGIIF